MSNHSSPPIRPSRIQVQALSSSFGHQLSLSGDQLLPVEPIGDVRLRFLSSDNTSQAGAQARLSVVKDGQVVEQRLVTAGSTGYAATSLNTSRDSSSTIRVEPLVDGEPDQSRAREIDPGSQADTGANIVRVPATATAAPQPEHLGYGGLTKPPELPDFELAPELFNPAIIEKNGTCALDFTANVETRQYYFNQVVRKEAPSLIGGGREYVRDPTRYTEPQAERTQLSGPVPFDWPADQAEEAIAPLQAKTASLGKLNTYKQSWTRLGHGIGQLLYSLALAPCEQTKIAMLEWSREERGRRREQTRFDEEMQHALRRDRMIEEIVESVADEMQRGRSSSSQLGAGLTGGLASQAEKTVGSLGFSIGGSSASSKSFSEGHREIHASTLHNLSDRVSQSGSAMRSLRSMVVTQSAESESESIRTRTVRNQNHNHAMTVEYFQVLEHYAVRTELHAQRDVLLVPYEVPAALFETLPPYTRFRSNIQRFRQALATIPGEMANEFAPARTTETSSGDGEYRTRRHAFGPISREGIKEAVMQAVEEAEIELTMGERVATVVDAAVHNAWSGIEGRNALDQDHFKNALRHKLEASLRTFQQSQPEYLLKTSELIAWLDAHSESLRELVPDEHIPGLNALFSLVHTPETYETDIPRATASRWTVELREAWRSGLAIVLHTTDGQAVPLRPQEDRPGSAIGTFTSPPVDVQAIEAVEVTFAPEEAMKTVVRNVAKDMGILEEVGESVANVLSRLPGNMETLVQERIEVARTYTLSRLRLSAHTDVSDDLPRSKTYQILDHTAQGTGEKLTAADHSRTLHGLQRPNIDFLVTSTRRYRDYSRLEQLANHITANRMDYLRALWLSEDPDRRAMRLARYTYPYESAENQTDQVPLLQLIENQPVGVFGNQVAFPLLEQGQMELYAPVAQNEQMAERLITLPSKGVYAETLLSKCNAREIRDVQRMYDPEERCPGQAPDITGISPGSRRAGNGAQPSTMPGSTLQQQAAPQAPAPQGMGAALQAIASGGMFRDMSRGSETVQAAQALAERAMQESGAAQRATLEALDQKLQQAQQNAANQSEAAAVREARQRAQAARHAAQQRANQEFWKTDPVQLRDREQAINDSNMTPANKERARQRNYNAEVSPAAQVSQASTGAGQAARLDERLIESVSELDWSESLVPDPAQSFQEGAYYNRFKTQARRNWLIERENWLRRQIPSRQRFPQEPGVNLDGLPIPPWVDREFLYKQLRAHYQNQQEGLTEAERSQGFSRSPQQILGNSRTMGANDFQPLSASYFVIHDTAGTSDYTDGTVPGGVHSWIGTVSLARDRDWSETGQATRLESNQNTTCFLHVELTRATAESNRSHAAEDDHPSEALSTARDAGTIYTRQQYDDLANAYIVASLRRGRLLTVTAHLEMDRSIQGAHYDPVGFELATFYQRVAKKLMLPLASTFGIEQLRLTESNPGGEANMFIPYVKGEVAAANQYGPILPQEENPEDIFHGGNPSGDLYAEPIQDDDGNTISVVCGTGTWDQGPAIQEVPQEFAPSQGPGTVLI
jgi:hypothetical protein